MLGVLDVDWEVQHEDEIELVKFAGPTVEEPPLAHAPFTEAIADFRARRIMTPAAFKLLEDGARRKAFSIAGMVKRDLLATAHAELLRQIDGSQRATHRDPNTGKWIYEGPNFREFKTFVRDRLESAGWTPANPSHVETVFRTNVMSAYAGGRVAQMKSPAVVDRMPYWQIRGVSDSRQRPTHKAALGIVLPANHAFWKSAYPPFGYNCRCRVVARSKAWVDRTSTPIGPVPQGLPDPGFDSGTKTLPEIPASLQAPAPEPEQRGPAVPPPQPAASSGPVRAPAAIPVALPFEAPRPPATQPIAPPPAPPRRPVDRATFEAMGVNFIGETQAERDAAHSAFQETADRVFGRTLDPQQVLRILGAPHIPGRPMISVRGRAGFVNLRATYIGPSGEMLATVSRQFRRDDDGPLVNHSLFELDSKLQGKGLARTMLRDAFQEYRSLGVKRIELTAAWTGRYTWSRMGFEFHGSPAEFKSAVLKPFAAWLRRRGTSAEAATRMLESVRTMNDLARLQVGSKQLGKAFLTSLNDGVMFPMKLELDPASRGFQIASEYLGL